RVARTQVAVIPRLVIRMTRGQRPQPDRRQQPLRYHAKYRLPSAFLQNRIRQREREDLIRPTRRVGAALAVDDLVEIPAPCLPDAGVERVSGPPGPLREPSRIGVARLRADPAFPE